MNMNKILSFVLVIAILLCSVTAYAETSEEYPVAVHVDMAHLTVRLPEEAIYVTQDSTVNDLYFMLVGAENYDAIMNDLKSNSVYFDAVSTTYTWEVRIAVQPGGAPLDFKGMDESVAQIFLSTLTTQYSQHYGLVIDDSFVTTADGYAFLAFRASMQGRNIYTIMTTSGSDLLAITVSDVYSGSIEKDNLKNVAMAIINGFVFD